MLNQAETASTDSSTQFRGVFLQPLSPRRLKQRLKHTHVTMLMKIPNNCMSFIPAHYWQDGRNKSLGCYNQENTNMVILLYQSNHTNELPKLNMTTLRFKLAAWFLRHCPPTNLTRQNLLNTGVPVEYYQRAYKTPFPKEWKFWAPHDQTKERTQSQKTIGMYPGASNDTAHEAPFADIISLDHQATSLGFLPATFPQFLRHASTNEDIPTARLVSLISQSLRSHTYRMLRKHRQLTLAHRMHVDTSTVTAPVPHSRNHETTTTLITLPNPRPEFTQDDDPLSHLYYREDDSPHVDGD
jgi:hypothetical protein